MNAAPVIDVEIRHFHMACGLGGGARGFNRGQARLGNLRAKFVCLGGVDVDPAACRDFGRLAGVPATCLDLFSREQYIAFHGHVPPPGWCEALPEDIRRAAGGKRPHIVFASYPCKGFSGLLSEKASGAAKYVALNGLTVRGMWIALEAWKDDPPELIIFENVPRIATRGRHLVDRIVALWRAYGYAVAETTHDCGELGNLAQSRKRFLMVGRFMAKVPSYLYEPVKRPLRGVGEVIGALPVPGPEPVLLPMHRLPALHWKTWVRLAFVEAGKDWRSLNALRVEGGMLADFGLAREYGYRGTLGVTDWDKPLGTVTSRSMPSTGTFAIADPRVDGHAKSVMLGVRPWDKPAGVVTSKMIAGGGPHSVADPRPPNTLFNHAFRIVRFDEPAPAVAGSGGAGGGLAVADPRASEGQHVNGKYRVTAFDEPSGAVIAASTTGNGAFVVADPRTGFGESTHHHVLKITPWDRHGGTITAAHHPAGGALSVADPRTGYGPNSHRNKLAVVNWGKNAGTVTGSDRVGSGALSVADPRPGALSRADRDSYLSQGHYGVTPWDQPSGAVPAHAKNNNGKWSVADPRVASDDVDAGASGHNADGECGEYRQPVLPSANDRLVCMIRALDGTWHRPFTTLELAALQGLVDPEETLELDGLSDSAWRERIGNMVPPPAATAIAGVMGRLLLGVWNGERFSISKEPIWVRPVAVALMAAQGDVA